MSMMRKNPSRSHLFDLLLDDIRHQNMRNQPKADLLAIPLTEYTCVVFVEKKFNNPVELFVDDTHAKDAKWCIWAYI